MKSIRTFFQDAQVGSDFGGSADIHAGLSFHDLLHYDGFELPHYITSRGAMPEKGIFHEARELVSWMITRGFGTGTHERDAGKGN